MSSPRTSPRSVWEWARVIPENAAVIDPDGTSVTFKGLAGRVNASSRALRQQGFGPGERIALLAGNRSETLEILLACAQTGLLAVPVNTHGAPAEIAYILADCGARALFVDDESAARGLAALDAAGLDGLPVFGLCGDVGETVPSWRPRAGLHAADDLTDRIAGSVMLYTSGTTGRPKGVVWPLGSASPEESLSAAAGLMARRGMTDRPGQTSLVSGPLYHGAPGSWALQALHHGHTTVLMSRWDSEHFLRLVERHRVRTTQLAPVHFARLLALDEEVRTRYDLSSLEVVSHAGAATPVEVKRAMTAWLGPVLWEYYASSEGYGTSISPDEWLEHPGSVGRADGDGALMSVRDEHGVEVEAGTVGTLYIRNPGGVRSRYHGIPQDGVEAADEFFTAGDLARIDADGWLFIVDRRTDLIISGGVNIYPAEVEQALRHHHAVEDVAVVAVPDPEWGHSVAAVVVVGAGQAPDAQLEADIRQVAGEHIARFKLPKTFEFRAHLPYSSTGKLLRRVLRDELAETTTRTPVAMSADNRVGTERSAHDAQ